MHERMGDGQGGLKPQKRWAGFHGKGRRGELRHSFIVRPHADDFHRPLLRIDLIH